MRIVKCRKCGFSWAIAQAVRFNDNGTITLFLAKDFRVALIEADFFTEVFDRIEQELGLPIMHIVFEAQRNASAVTINANIRGPLKMGRWLGLSKRVAVSIFCRMAVWTGQSYAKALVYKPHWLGEAIVRNPFNRELMAAVIVGAFEALEREPFGHTWLKKGDDDIISIRPEPSRPDIAERMTFTVPPTRRGNRVYPRCSCGVPAGLNLQWDNHEGVIMDTHRNVRMVFLDSYTPNVVFRELVRELGDEIYPIIIDAQRAFSLRHLRGEFPAAGAEGDTPGKEAFYLAALDTLALRGRGNPVDWSSQGERFTVVIENPFEEHLLAGHLAAMYELGEGRPAGVTWKELGPSTLEFTLVPAGDAHGANQAFTITTDL